VNLSAIGVRRQRACSIDLTIRLASSTDSHAEVVPCPPTEFRKRWAAPPPPPLFIRYLQRSAQSQARQSAHLPSTIFDFVWSARISLDVMRHRREKGRGRRCLRALLFVKLVEQGPGIFQVGGIETLREPVVDFGQHRARLITLALLRQQARETRRRAQLP
jgi:hypothetical protein